MYIVSLDMLLHIVPLDKSSARRKYLIKSYHNSDQLTCHSRDTCGVYLQCESFDVVRERLAQTISYHKFHKSLLVQKA